MPRIVYFENIRQGGQHLKWESLCQISQALQMSFPEGWHSLHRQEGNTDNCAPTQEMKKD